VAGLRVVDRELVQPNPPIASSSPVARSATQTKQSAASRIEISPGDVRELRPF
jgi:hypothetical protein